MTDKKRLEAVLEWAWPQFIGWRTILLDDEDRDVEEASGIILEELPLALEDYDEDSLGDKIVKYRLKHGINEENMDGEDWRNSDLIAEHIHEDFKNSGGKNLARSVQHAILEIKDYHDLAKILGDEKFLAATKKWHFTDLY